MKKALVEQIKKLGLSDYEAKIYITLLENSPAGASFIAKKCGLSRSSVYTTLTTLNAKGLVGISYKNEVKQFIAEEPRAIEQMLRHRKDEAEKRLEDFSEIKSALDAMQNDSMNIPQMVYFEGKDALQRIYRSMLRDAPNNSTVCIIRDEFVWTPDWEFIFKEPWRSWVRNIKNEKNILTRLLINDSTEEQKHLDVYKSREDVSYRFLPKKYSMKEFVIYILGDVVSILSMEDGNLVGVKITNRAISENYQRIFDTMWDKAKK